MWDKLFTSTHSDFPVQVTLLGPQRRPTVDQVAGTLSIDAPLATVTAGWQEREPDDAELDSLLGGRTINLNLYGRWLDVQARDPEFSDAELEHQTLLEELRLLSLVQLQSAKGAIYALAQRNGDRPSVIEAALTDAHAVVRLLDDRHMSRVRAANQEFNAKYQPFEREVVAEHRELLRHVLGEAGALVVAGGHVGVLLRLMRLFGVTDTLPDTLVAWSAGAMALTDRVVLFHDRTPQGPTPAEIYDDGLGAIRGAVLLPHGRRRLRVDDPLRMAGLARRFAPAKCVVLDDGVRLDLQPDGALPAGARVIAADGQIQPLGDES